jgi:hypothetical protein
MLVGVSDSTIVAVGLASWVAVELGWGLGVSPAVRVALGTEEVCVALGETVLGGTVGTPE